MRTKRERGVRKGGVPDDTEGKRTILEPAPRIGFSASTERGESARGDPAEKKRWSFFRWIETIRSYKVKIETENARNQISFKIISQPEFPHRRYDRGQRKNSSKSNKTKKKQQKTAG